MTDVPALVVVRALGLVTVQDLGRPGRMHEALAPGGALVPELLVAANRAIGNRDGAPALEVLGRLVVRAQRAVRIAVDVVGRTLAGGEELVIDSVPARVVYVAIEGGVDAPLVLGGRATQLSAGLGAPLRAGDPIAAVARTPAELAQADSWFGHAETFPGELVFSDDDPTIRTSDEQTLRMRLHHEDDLARSDRPIRVIPGPDLDAFPTDALDALCARPWRISPTSDRVGTRLDGGRLPVRPGDGVSRPMVKGAIEVPPDGTPIVLGPEHPTTGGYPVLGVVVRADLGRFFTVRLGGDVRFAIAHDLRDGR